MKQSQLFTKTQKNAPKDEVSLNAQLLIRGGFVHKEMAGVYTYLPLGLRIINKIADIVRDEMNKIGGIEIQSAALQKRDSWEKSGRWDDKIIDNWFKTKLKNNVELGLAFTHEEPLTSMMTNFISSYKDLPVYIYDIRSVFRNEARAKSGIMRGREFFWKALYSFSRNESDHFEYYERAKQAYKNVFERLGLGEKTYITFASGGSFSKYSHEFQTICDAGEDLVYVDEHKRTAVNKEVFTDKTLDDLGLKRNNLIEKKAIEVGNIFSLGHKFSEPIGLYYKDENGRNKPVYMGCYGIGISRLMGTIVELYNDEKGIIWPDSVAPFDVHIISLDKNKEAEKIYRDLMMNGIDVLFDDRDKSAGEKFSDADLIGIPKRIVISEKSMAGGGVEVKKRNERNGKIVSISDCLSSC